MDARDHQEFGDFMVSRWPALVRLGYGLTGDRWLAEDLAQTALASACAAWWRVRRADDPDAYVRRILINASNRRFRRRGAGGQAEFPAGTQLRPAGPGQAAVDPAAAIGERSVLMTALAQLPPRQRAVIVLRYWLDLSDVQAAAVLGCSAGTVRSQAARALAKLRRNDALADSGPGDQAARR